MPGRTSRIGRVSSRSTGRVGAGSWSFGTTASGEPAIEVLFNGAGGEREPTRANILKALTRLRDSAGEADTVALLLAGHGEGGEGGSFFFLPTDAKLTGAGAIGDNAINWNEILDALPKAGRRSPGGSTTCATSSTNEPTNPIATRGAISA